MTQPSPIRRDRDADTGMAAAASLRAAEEVGAVDRQHLDRRHDQPGGQEARGRSGWRGGGRRSRPPSGSAAGVSVRSRNRHSHGWMSVSAAWRPRPRPAVIERLARSCSRSRPPAAPRPRGRASASVSGVGVGRRAVGDGPARGGRVGDGLGWSCVRPRGEGQHAAIKDARRAARVASGADGTPGPRRARRIIVGP